MKTTEQSGQDDDTNDESVKSLAIKRWHNGGDESDKSLARTAPCSFYRRFILRLLYRTTPKC